MSPIGGPRRLDYILVLLLINLSGNQALVSGNRQDIILVLTFFVVVARMLVLRRLANRTFCLVAFFFLILLLFQAVSLNFFSLPTIAGFMVKLTIAAGVVSSVPFFRMVFVRVMVWLTLLSFVFHVPALLAGSMGIHLYDYVRPIASLVGVESSGVNERINILLHNFMAGDHMFRNSGVFWEPGAFSGYLILALLLLASVQNTLPKRLVNIWRVVISVGVLSTISTMGYILLPFAHLAFSINSGKNRGLTRAKALRMILFLSLLLPVAYFSWSLEFLGPKINELYHRAVFQEAGWHLSRFGNILFDWEYIQGRPFLGWGQSNTTQFSLHPGLEELSVGNGLTGFLRQMGVVGFSIFLFSYWYGLGRLKVRGFLRAWIVFLTLVQLNGELFLLYPMYLGLMFIGLDNRADILYLRRLRSNNLDHGAGNAYLTTPS